MSALYGRMDTDAAKHQVTRRGHYTISATLETWEGEITVALSRDGSFEVTVADKDESKETIPQVMGNVNESKRELFTLGGTFAS